MLPGTRTPRGFRCPDPCGPLGPPGGETGGPPRGTNPPLSPATPSARQDGELAPTVLSQPGRRQAGPVVWGWHGTGPAPGATQEERGGGTAQAHSSFLKGPLLLREEAANGEDKAEVR